jgi:hypothetical protein
MFHVTDTIKKLPWFILGASIFFTPILAEPSAEEVFTYMYKHKQFGKNSKGEAHSGGGSTMERTALYREFLQEFLKVFNIHSVVDMGCGDWEFSQAIDWSGIDYKGYDVVKSVINKNRKKYETDHIHFKQCDGVYEELPIADLLICKDVLQHLPNEDILAFIQQLPKFKYCLITNDVDPITETSSNPNIKRGGFRPVDLTQPPFSLKGIKILTYMSDTVPKQVLLIKSEN